LDTPSYIVQN